MTTSSRNDKSNDSRVTRVFVSFVMNKPALAMVAGLLLVMAFGAGASKLKPNFTHTAFFDSDNPMMRDLERFEKQFGNDDAVVIVVHSPSGIFDLESATLLQELTRRMWLVTDVIRVTSLSNFSWVHAEEDDIEVESLIPDEEPLTPEILVERRGVALNHEALPDYLVSKDGKTALVYAKIRPGFESPPAAKDIVDETKKVVAEMQGGDHTFHITGGPTINDAFREATEKDLEGIIPFVLLMAVVALIALLRSVVGTLLPLMVIATSIVAAFGFGGWIGLEISAVTMVLPQVLIGVAIADAVHILSTFDRARRRGMAKREATELTLSKNFIPTILTGITTAAGFFSFFTSGLRPIFGLGVMAGVGTIVAWFSTYLILGSLLVLLPSWLKRKEYSSQLTTASKSALNYTSWLYRFRWQIIGVYFLVCVASVWLALSNNVNSDPYKYFAKDFPIRKAQDFIIDELSGVAVFEMSVTAGAEDGIKDPAFLKKVEEFDKRLVAIDGVAKSVSLLDVFKQTNRSLNGGRQEEYRLPETKELVAQEFFLYTMSLPQGMDVNDQVTVKNDAIRMTLISSITDSARWTETATHIMKIGDELGLDVLVSGKTRLYQSMNGYVTRSFIQSLLIAVVLVSLILIVAFRSFRWGALAMLPNLVPLIVGGAVLKLLDHSLDIGTMLVCSVCLGIAVDDTIHILANFLRYRREDKGPTEAIALTLTHTGPALFVTTFVLVASFGTLAFATFIPNVYFGIMTAVVLSAALLADFTLWPAILMVNSPKPERPTALPEAKTVSAPFTNA